LLSAEVPKLYLQVVHAERLGVEPLRGLRDFDVVFVGQLVEYGGLALLSYLRYRGRG
jgi:hypothetical protein